MQYEAAIDAAAPVATCVYPITFSSPHILLIKRYPS